MYVGKHAALILWAALTALLVIVVLIVIVIATLVRNRARNLPGAKSWPTVIGISVALVGLLLLLLR